MSRYKRFGLLAVSLALLTAAVVLFSYARNTEKSQLPLNTDKPSVTPLGPQSGPEKEAPAAVSREVTLYFSDNQALYLLPEERTLTLQGKPLAEAVVQALIEGPRLPGRTRTIPEGTKLLSLSLSDDTAIVNFSRELRTNHWGGSAGEMMTVYSVVNSLARIKGISRVQFLIEGQKIETLTGHLDLTAPVTPRWDLVKQPLK